MPPPEFHILLTALILAGGVGIFLRLVGKEKHRREKWLQLRSNKKIKELKEVHMQADAREIEAISIDDTKLSGPE